MRPLPRYLIAAVVGLALNGAPAAARAQNTSFEWPASTDFTNARLSDAAPAQLVDPDVVAILVMAAYMMGHIEYDSFKVGLDFVIFLDSQSPSPSIAPGMRKLQANASWTPPRFMGGVSVLHTEGTTVTAFTGGAEYPLKRLMPDSTVKWFAGGQAGLQRWFDQTDFLIQPAIAAEFALNGRMKGRGMFGLRMIFANGLTTGPVGSFGVVIPIGQ
jgi:hypothetical protein